MPALSPEDKGHFLFVYPQLLRLSSLLHPLRYTATVLASASWTRPQAPPGQGQYFHLGSSDFQPILGREYLSNE